MKCIKCNFSKYFWNQECLESREKMPHMFLLSWFLLQWDRGSRACKIKAVSKKWTCKSRIMMLEGLKEYYITE